MNVEESLEQLLDCMCSALGAAGWEGECCLNPGAPTLEMCCGKDNAMAWARLTSMYPSAQFPRQDEGGILTECAATLQWALVVELGASICVCDDTCSCAQKAENAHEVLNIAEAALRGILCCFATGACRDSEFRVNKLEIGGPLGNCGGFTIELIRQHSMSCCPPEIPGDESS